MVGRRVGHHPVAGVVAATVVTQTGVALLTVAGLALTLTTLTAGLILLLHDDGIAV